MEWLFGAAAVPLLLCGAMCIGGAAVAAIASRRNKAGAAKSDTRQELPERVPTHS